MEKIDVLKLVRDNQEKFKAHLQKMKELENKDKELDYHRQYKNYNQNLMERNDRLTTIPEGENETHSVKKSLNINENSGGRTPIYQEIGNESEEDEKIKEIQKHYGDSVSDHRGKMKINYNYGNNNYDNSNNPYTYSESYNHNINEKLSKEEDYDIREEKKNYQRSDNEDSYQLSQSGEINEEGGIEEEAEEEEAHNYADGRNYNNMRSDNEEGASSDLEVEQRNEEVNNNYDENDENYIERSDDDEMTHQEIKNKIRKVYDDSESENGMEDNDEDHKINSNNNKQFQYPPIIDNANASQNVSNSKKFTPKFNNNINLARSNSTLKSSVQVHNSRKSSNSPLKGHLGMSQNNKSTIKPGTINSTNKITGSLKHSEKRPYTAYTYSTIKKMKASDKEIKKTSLFQEKVLSQRKYNGKSDRVALYQQMKSYWDKKPYLANPPIKNFESVNDKIDPVERMKLQKLKNLKKPLRHYTKFI